jgi:hypothetical protein
MRMIPIADALNAVEKNARAFLVLAGENAFVSAKIDTMSGTASIRHARNGSRLECMIYFPALPSQAKLSSDELERWTGYFIHEICHALYTDEQAWKRAVSLRLHDLVNGMEDVRIERLLNAKAHISNSKELLEKLLAWVVSEVPASANYNDPRQLSWVLALAGRLKLCGYSLPQGAAQLAGLNRAMAKLVDGALLRLDKAQSTGDVLDIAVWLQKQMAQGKAGNGKPDHGDGKPGEGEGKPGEGKPGEGKPGEGKPGAGEGEGEGAGAGAGAGAGQPFDATQCKPVSYDPVSKKVKAESNALRGKADGGVAARVAAMVVETIRAAQKDSRLSPFTDRAGPTDAAIMQKAAQECSKLRAQVARVLKAEENETWQHGRTSGRLDRAALARASMGVENAFARRTIAGGYETEIDVLVDASSSMSGGRMFAASILAFVIAQAAQQVGVKASVTRFAGGGVRRVKETSAQASTMASAFAALAMSANGGTPLSPSIIKSAANLTSRAPSKRRMLFIVTDGACDNGEIGVKAACDYAESLGVETVGLCIDMPVHSGFRLGVTCRSADIAESGLGMLVKALERVA